MNEYENKCKDEPLIISKDDEKFSEYINLWVFKYKDMIKDELRTNNNFPPSFVISKFRKEHPNWVIEPTHTTQIIKWVEHFRKQVICDEDDLVFGGDLK